MTDDRAYQVVLEPTTQDFVDALAASGNFPLSGRSADTVRTALANLQSGPVGRPDASIEDTTLPVGPKGVVHVRIIRPREIAGTMPAIVYLHGGGWVAGGADTHDRLVREIAIGTQTAVVFVKFGRAPEAKFPIPVEEAYAATEYIAQCGTRLKIDGTRLAVVGDGTGGNIAAAVALKSKERHGPKIGCQVLFYPVTAANFEGSPYREWYGGSWVTRDDMEWLWNAYLPDESARIAVTAAPLTATIDQLRGLPETLLITAEADVLRDEGEAYARRLSEACVRTTCTRYIGTIHDFVMLNALADTPAARAAIEQASSALRSALA